MVPPASLEPCDSRCSVRVQLSVDRRPPLPQGRVRLSWTLWLPNWQGDSTCHRVVLQVEPGTRNLSRGQFLGRSSFVVYQISCSSMVELANERPLVTVVTESHGRTGIPLDSATSIILVTIGSFTSTFVFAFPAAFGDVNGALWTSVVGAVGIGCGCFLLARRQSCQPWKSRWLRIGPLFSLYYALVFGVFSLAWLVPQTGDASLVDASASSSRSCAHFIGSCVLGDGIHPRWTCSH